MRKKELDDLVDFTSKFRNYSKQDGRQLEDLKSKNTLRKRNKDYCPNCNTKNELNNIYCKECGCCLEVTEKKRFKINKKDIVSNLDLSHSVKVVALASAIMFIISLIISFALRYKIGKYGTYIGALDVFLLANGGRLNAIINSGSFIGTSSYAMNLQIGIIPFIILPILSIIISYRAIRKTNKSTNMISDIVGISLVYSLLLVVISIVSKQTMSVSGGLTSYGYSLSLGFNIVMSLLKGLIIGSLSVLLIYIRKNSGIYFEIFKDSIKTISIGYIIIFILLVAGYFIGFRYVNELGISSYTRDLNIGIIISQLAVYVWGFVNIIPVLIGSQNLSIFNIFSTPISTDFKLILIALTALSALILFVVGYKLREKYKDLKSKSVLIFSIIYSLVMGVIAMFTVININGGNMIQFNAYVSMNFIIAIFSSFLYSYIVTSIGFKLNDAN